MTRRAAALLALLAGGAALISGVTMLDGIQPNDEGVMLAAAARIAHGEVPYRDFWWFYPPGQPYLLALLWKAFGPSLLTWRILRVATDAAVAVLAYLLARRGGASPRLALAVWLAAALAMAYPSGPHPFALTLAFSLGALLLFEQRPTAAGVLAGLAAAWRLESAAYLVAGIALAGAWSAWSTGGARMHARSFARAFGRFAVPALGVALALYAPVVAAAGLGRSWHLLVRYPLVQWSDYQSLPFPFSYGGPLNTSSIGGFLSDSAENLLVFYLPLVLVVGLAASLVALGLRARELERLHIATVVVALGAAHYLLVRPDVFHTASLAVMVAVLATWAVRGARSLAAVVAAAGAAASIAYATVEGLDRRWLELRADRDALRLPAADGVRVAPAVARPLEGAVRYVRARVPPGDPIYVATRRSDLVTSGDGLFYVLAGRPNATPYDIQAPGVVTTVAVQREIIGDLDRSRTRVVVRWTSPVTAAAEPDRAGRPSGVTLLDAYLARTYRRAAAFGSYVILERRARSGTA
ncbi:MAG: hypothetical protein ACJ76Z_04320 [Thermoleophilaceae bacterium]